MNQFGWGDPIESPVVLVYRRKGEKREHEFSGAVGVLGEDHNSITWFRREDLPLREGRLDLTMIPVVGIGGKRKHQPGRVQSFLEENHSFQGALLLYPGTGNWDLGEGMLFVTSREILSGRRVSGGRPEVQLTNHRWLRDGRYVADRTRVLHGKVLETLATEVEQEPGIEEIVKAITLGSIPHRLYDIYNRLSLHLQELERRRVMLSGERARDMAALVRAKLTEKFQDVRYIRDISESITVTAEEVDPDLMAQAETLGMIEIPGLGSRLISSYERFFGGEGCPVVEIKLEELRSVTDWVYMCVGIRVPELGTTRDELYQGQLHDALWSGWWDEILEYFSRRWVEVQRQQNYPRSIPVVSPLEGDPPATPAPVVWGHDLMTGEAKTAYAALVHDVHGFKGRIVDSGWEIRWYDDLEQAAKADAEGRREAESFITARRLEAELTAEAKATDLPVAVPPAYVTPSHTPEEILAMAGFTSDQYRIREDIDYWYTRGYSGRRDSWDGEWYEGQSSTGSFARKGEDGVWEIGQSGLTHLFEGGQIGDYNWKVVAKPVLAEMGAGEKIVTIQAQIKAEREASEEAYRSSVRSFVNTLQALPAYASLSSDMQAKLVRLASNSWGTPSIDEAELRSEWAKAEALQRQVALGAILTNWGGHFRVMGATGNAQYWVIRPDGSEREPDEVSYRKRYSSEGEKKWRLVGPEELALTWSKAYTAALHEFTVAKLPTGGCTAEQLATVECLEREIDERFYGITGMSGTASPWIGEGWGLHKRAILKPIVLESKPAVSESPEPSPVVESKPVDLSQVDLSGLFGGAARRK